MSSDPKKVEGAKEEEKRVCLGCGRQIPITAYACQYCGKPVFEQPKPQTNFALVGGIFCIIAGLIGMFFSVLVIAFGYSILFLIGSSIALVCGSIWIIFSILAIIGGIFALQKRNFAMAVVGSVFALFCAFGIFGIIALIFVIVGKNEFEGENR
jgi:hypothetical protein